MNKLNDLQHEALLAVEWCRNDNNGAGYRCPWCGEQQSVRKHKSGCRIGDAIATYRRVEDAQKLLVERTPIFVDQKA